MGKSPHYMLDTSVCIEILRGRVPPESVTESRCSISSIVEAELWAGVYHSGGDHERSKVKLLLGVVDVVAFDSAAAEATGRVLSQLTKAGLPIGDFDAQIAGHATSLGATLVTANSRHFRRVDGLSLLDWSPPKSSKRY